MTPLKPSQIYDDCAEELLWLAQLLGKAIRCLEEGDYLGGGIKLERLMTFMDAKEENWREMASWLEKEEGE